MNPQQPLFVRYANLQLGDDLGALKTYAESLPCIPVKMERAPEVELEAGGILHTLAELMIELGPNLAKAEEKLGLKRIRNIKLRLNCSHRLAREYGRIPSQELYFNWESYRDLNFVGEVEAAFEALHGYRFGYCYYDDDETGRTLNCPKHDLECRREYHSGNCLECGRRWFGAVLSRIALGTPLREIKDLATLSDLTAAWRRPSGWRNPMGDGSWATGPDNKYPFKHLVSDLIHAMAGAELLFFLEEKGPEWLHLCEQCGDFFMGHPNRKTCPPPKNCAADLKNVRARAYVRRERALGNLKYF